MNILQLLFWFLAYSTGIAGLSLGAAAYLKSRSPEGKLRLMLILSFSALVIPAMLNNLFEASGLLWSMRQNSFSFLTTSLAVLGFWGGIYLARSFLTHELGDRYKKHLNRGSIVLTLLITVSVFLYLAVPDPHIGLISTWLTGAVLILFPGAALFTVVRSLVKKKSCVYLWAGLVTIGFAIFYTEIVPVESFSIFPAFFIGLNLVFLPSFVRSLAAQPSGEPDQEKLKQMGISPREAEVVCLLLLGLSYKEIGEKLYISLPTVQTHVSRIYQKTGVNSKMELSRLFSV